MYLHGGNDRVTRTGPAGGPVQVRVIVGGGQDVVDDSKSGGTDVWTDKGEAKVERGDGTHVRRNTWTNPAPVKDAPVARAAQLRPPDGRERRLRLPPRHRARPRLRPHPHGLGLPHAAGQRACSRCARAITTGAGTGKIEYEGTFRRIGTGLSFRFETFASDIEQFNFFGYGNDSTGEPTEKDYRAEQKVVFARPTARFELGRRLEAFLGPEVRYSDSPRGFDTILGSTAPYGIGYFTQAAVRGGFHFDSRQRPDAWSSRNITESVTGSASTEQVTGVNVQASGFYAPSAWDVTDSYGGVDGVRGRLRRFPPRPPRRARGRAPPVGRRALVRGCRTSAA